MSRSRIRITQAKLYSISGSVTEASWLQGEGRKLTSTGRGEVVRGISEDRGNGEGREGDDCDERGEDDREAPGAASEGRKADIRGKFGRGSGRPDEAAGVAAEGLIVCGVHVDRGAVAGPDRGVVGVDRVEDDALGDGVDAGDSGATDEGDVERAVIRLAEC